MPQFEIENFLNQLSWTIILFYFYYYIMKTFILPMFLEKSFYKFSLLNINSKTTISTYTSINKNFPEF